MQFTPKYRQCDSNTTLFRFWNRDGILIRGLGTQVQSGFRSDIRRDLCHERQDYSRRRRAPLFVRTLLLKTNGSANIPPAWIERARLSRKGKEKALAQVLKSGKVKDFLSLEDWELRFRKECFYHGLRVLLELERKGKTKL